MNHNNHDLTLFYEVVGSQAYAALITYGGDVEVVVADPARDRINVEGAYLYCNTCSERVYAGEGGLAEGWQVV